MLSSVRVTVAELTLRPTCDTVVLPGIVISSSPSTMLSSVGVMVSVPLPLAGVGGYSYACEGGRTCSPCPFVALPARVPMVTTVFVGQCAAVQRGGDGYRSSDASSSPRVFGLADSVIPVGASSSSVIVVVTLLSVPRLGRRSASARRTRYAHREGLVPLTRLWCPPSSEP